MVVHLLVKVLRSLVELTLDALVQHQTLVKRVSVLETYQLDSDVMVKMMIRKLIV